MKICGFCGKPLVNSEGTMCEECASKLGSSGTTKEGWVCPVCGRGVAPGVKVCPCSTAVETKHECDCGGKCGDKCKCKNGTEIVNLND